MLAATAAVLCSLRVGGHESEGSPASPLCCTAASALRAAVLLALHCCLGSRGIGALEFLARPLGCRAALSCLAAGAQAAARLAVAVRRLRPRDW